MENQKVLFERKNSSLSIFFVKEKVGLKIFINSWSEVDWKNADFVTHRIVKKIKKSKAESEEE